MKIRFVRDNIINVKTDAIVNTSNPYPLIGGGVDSAIYEAAGEKELLKERKKIGNIERGQSRITSGFDLCRYIIHTVGPKYIDGHHSEEKLLRSCYRSSLELAKENQCTSIAFPLISTGVYGFPVEEAVSIAVSEINDYLINHSNSLQVTICVFDDESYVTCLKIADIIENNIDSQGSENLLKQEYSGYYDDVKLSHKEIKKQKTYDKQKRKSSYSLQDNSRTFAEMIYFYLAKRDEKPSVYYESVGIDRRLFSKITKNNYHPSKITAIKMCIGLRLTLPQSIDLLSRCDYAFNPSKPEDSIISNGIKKNKTLKEIRFDLQEAGLKKIL